MRVGFGLALCVMLAMHRDPLARDHARREPEPEAEEVARDRMEIESAMRLMAMQEDRHARDRHVREQQRCADVAPNREVKNAAERHTESHLPLRKTSPHRQYRKHEQREIEIRPRVPSSFL